MILIAESGSTKTDWALIDISSDTVICFSTGGMNPYSGYDAKSIVDQIEAVLNSEQISGVNTIYFYGSGCVNDTSIALIRDNLQAWFVNATSSIKDDLYGAALAMSGGQPCYIGILGTGSIAAYFDGKEVINKSISLGYLISNEGGGADIGAQVIKALINNRLPADIMNAYQDFAIGQHDLLDILYNTENPSQIIAGYSKPIAQFANRAEVKDIVAACFEKYYTWQLSGIIKERSLAVHFIGSIAYHYSHILDTVLNKHQLQLGAVEKKPLQKLISYHQSHNIT